MGTIRGSGEADRKDKLPFGRQDGQLHDLALGQVLELNFTRTPGLTRVPTGELALERLEAEADRYNLIIASPAIRDMPAEKLAREVRRRGFDVPVVQVGERASARPVRVHEKHFVRPTRWFMHQRRPYSGSLHGGWRRTSRGMMSIQEKPIPWEDGDLSWPRRFFQTPWTLLTAPQSFGSRLHARASTGGLRFVVCSLAASASLAAAQGINPSIGGSGSLFLCCLFLGVVPRRWMERNGRRVSSRHVASCVCYVAGSLVLLWALARLILVSLFGLELLWLGGDFGGLLDLRFTQPTWILLSPLFFLLLMPVCSGLYDSPLARAAQGLLAPFLLSGLWVWFLVNNATLAT